MLPLALRLRNTFPSSAFIKGKFSIIALVNKCWRVREGVSSVDVWIMLCLIVAIPVVSTVLEWLLLNGIPERHHRHHDTYRVSNTLTHVQVLVMDFMGVLGLVFYVLCITGVFQTNTRVLLAFFTAFLVVTAAYWSDMHRYKVVTYDDHMFVSSFIGPGKTVYYDKILRMEWRPARPFSSFKNVHVYTEDLPGHVTLWGILDLQQILLSINRFDMLEGSQM